MLTVQLDQQSYSPGDIISAAIILKLDSEKRARGLFARLVCVEQTLHKTNVVLDKYEYDRDKEMSIPYSSHMETRTETREKTWFSKEIRLVGNGTFASSEYTAVFQLPPGAPPTSHEFGHDGKIHVWKVCAKLDIPLAIDENGEAEVFVEGL
ncbi:MAG: hypothetical protein NT051_01915 [Candidatus Micrarchaeota archaeon]|nr:hypothetical protein [Candidatus Micrarchaeota archaeon]